MIDASGYQRQHDIHRDLNMASNDADTMAIILQKLVEVKEEIKAARVEILQEIRATHAAGEANATASLHNSRVGMEDRLKLVVAAATHEAPPGVPNTIQQPAGGCRSAVAGSISTQPQPVQMWWVGGWCR